MMGLFEWMSQSVRTLAVWQWGLLLLIPPLIVLLYFLKLRRVPLEVPSTYLWQKAMEDLHVNSLWQRLRQNLLLFLQLLFVLLAILACWRPSWQGNQLADDRYIFLIDTSASMSATDVAPNRLEFAKQQVLALVEERLRSGSVAMVVSFSDRPIVEQSFTDNRNLLKRKIRAIAPTQRTSNLEEALRLAAGLANPGRTASEETDVAAAEALPATLMIFSDGRFRHVPQFAMGNLKPVFVPMGTAVAENVGIVAFSSRVVPEKPEVMSVFARLHNFGPTPAQVTANLIQPGAETALLDAGQVDLPAGEGRGIEFKLPTLESGELRLELQHRDALAADNVAHLAVNRRRRARVLMISPRNDALETALKTTASQKVADTRRETPDFLATPEYQQLASSGSLDLIIYDQCAPAQMPTANTYFVHALPPDGRWKQQAAQSLPQILDVDRTHPLLRYVEWGDVRGIVECRPLELPKGGTVLVDSHLGPLIAIAPRDGFEDLVQGFAIVATNEKGERFANTDWPIRVGFPVFIGNVLAYLGGTRTEEDVASILPGNPATIRSQTNQDAIDVVDPQGRATRLQRGARNAFLYSATDQIGTYAVREPSNNEIAQRFAVNLFDEVESAVGTIDTLKTSYEDVAGERGWETKRRELWKYFVAIALGLLLVEWYIYNRRVYI